MNSIRRSILTVIISLLLSGLLIISLLNLHDSNHEIAEVYDAQLAQNARLLLGVMRAPLSNQQQTNLYRAFNLALAQAMPKHDGHPYESKLAFQVWNLRGERLVQSASAPRLPQPPSATGFGTVRDFENHNWRVFVLQDDAAQLRIWVGERDDVRADLVQRIVRHTLWPNVVGSLLLAVLVWFAIGWGLRPLAGLAATLRARSPDSLQPLQLMPLPSELEPVQSALNRMLAQIQHVLARERRFIADAAHEMRTPLAVLRVHAQNLQQTDDVQQQRASVQHLIQGVDRTTRLVAQLLTKARLQPQAQAAQAQEEIDLASTVRASLAELSAWLLERGLELELDVGPGNYRSRLDTGAITIALNNLISNAANFSPPQGLISVQLRDLGDRFELRVADQGPGIDESKLARLFEPFYSQGNAQGAGLGLSIVQTIAERLGGQIQLSNRAQGGLLATLTLRRGESAQPQSSRSGRSRMDNMS